MPFISISLMAGRPQSQKKAVAKKISEIMEKEMGVNPDQLWIRFQDTAPNDWFTGPNSEEDLREDNKLIE